MGGVCSLHTRAHTRVLIHGPACTVAREQGSSAGEKMGNFMPVQTAGEGAIQSGQSIGDGNRENKE